MKTQSEFMLSSEKSGCVPLSGLDLKKGKVDSNCPRFTMSTKVDNQVFDSQQQEQTMLTENASESSLRLQKFPPRKMIDSNDQDMSGNFCVY